MPCRSNLIKIKLKSFILTTGTQIKVNMLFQPDNDCCCKAITEHISALKGDYSPDLLSVVSPSIEFSPVDSARLVLLLLLGCWKRKQMQI